MITTENNLRDDAKRLIEFHRKRHNLNIVNRAKDIDFVFGIRTPKDKEERVKIKYESRQKLFQRFIDGDAVFVWKCFDTLMEN